MNEMILFVIGFTVTLAIVVLADVLVTYWQWKNEGK